MPQTTVRSENGDLDKSQGVQNGDQLHNHSNHTNSDDTDQKAKQMRFSRQYPIEEGAMSSQVVEVEFP